MFVHISMQLFNFPHFDYNYLKKKDLKKTHTTHSMVPVGPKLVMTNIGLIMINIGLIMYTEGLSNTISKVGPCQIKILYYKKIT